MRDRFFCSLLKSAVMALTALLVVAASARAQNSPANSAEHESKTNPVVRSFGSQGGYRTEVRSEVQGTITGEDRRQVSLLAAQIFQHIDEARQAIDGEDAKLARKEVGKGIEALKAVRAMLPRTTVHTRTTAPDGKVIYEDEREVQDERVPLFEGMLHARTLAPIQEARRDANRIVGVQVVDAGTISTEAIADLGFVASQLDRAAKALDDRKSADAEKALLAAQTRGVSFRYSQEDTPLAEARDAIWLAKRALEENNAVQARANLTVARQCLEIYRKVLPENKRQDVSAMMSEVDQMEGRLRQEASSSAGNQDRSSQGNAMTRWWDQLNGWFKHQGK